MIEKDCHIHGITEGYHTKEGYTKCKKCRVEAVNKRRKKMKAMAVEYKGGKCEKCGYDKCIGALEFHHLDPSQKDFGIGGKRQTAAWETIKQEVDKCILVCANCHREIHANIDQSQNGTANDS